jgi:hypothetical protein
MASEEEVATENTGRDGWDKASILLRPLGGLLAALAVAGFGYFGSSYLNDRQDHETRMRLYTELISKREEAESALRKDMFTSIIGTFLEPKTAKLGEKLLQLELLAYNFHESLNLMPLFTYLNEQIENEVIAEAIKKTYTARLHKVAREITRKQMAILEGAGDKQQIEIDFSDTRNAMLQKESDPASDTIEIRRELFDLQVAAGEDIIRRSYTVSVKDVDTTAHEIRVRLEIRTPTGESTDKESEYDEFDRRITTTRDYTETGDPLGVDPEEESEAFADDESAGGDFPDGGASIDEFGTGDDIELIEAEFWVGPFDFPMIDNTRLPDDQRCAVILKRYDYPRVILSVICFPGSHASLKEKPYYDEIVKKLLSD